MRPVTVTNPATATSVPAGQSAPLNCTSPRMKAPDTGEIVVVNEVFLLVWVLKFDYA